MHFRVVRFQNLAAPHPPGFTAPSKSCCPTHPASPPPQIWYSRIQVIITLLVLAQLYDLTEMGWLDGSLIHKWALYATKGRGIIISILASFLCRQAPISSVKICVLYTYVRDSFNVVGISSNSWIGVFIIFDGLKKDRLCSSRSVKYSWHLLCCDLTDYVGRIFVLLWGQPTVSIAKMVSPVGPRDTIFAMELCRW